MGLGMAGRAERGLMESNFRRQKVSSEEVRLHPGAGTSTGLMK